MGLSYRTADVFTDTAFGGNPLAVVFGAEDLPEDRFQAIAREFNYSEITFVLPPRDPAHTAHVRIFTPTKEVPFAGHPNIGTATVLAWRGEAFGRAIEDRVIFEEEAGLVPVTVLRRDGRPVGAQLTAPQPFQRGPETSVADVATCLDLPETAIRTDRHPPVDGSVGLGFILVELADREALERCSANSSAFADRLGGRAVPDIYAYVRTEEKDSVDIRARVFAPLDGVPEDPATGSANAAMIGLLADLEGPQDGSLSWRIAQGVEMGRPSLLLGEVDRAAGATTAIRIGGNCVAVMAGEIIAP